MMNETPSLWSFNWIEHEALRIYTRNCFTVFKEILRESTFEVVIEIERDALYEVSMKTHLVIKIGSPNHSWSGLIKETKGFYAIIKGYEFEGFIGQHALKVMQYLGCEHLPK
jgi:hypothetical protein